VLGSIGPPKVVLYLKVAGVQRGGQGSVWWRILKVEVEGGGRKADRKESLESVPILRILQLSEERPNPNGTAQAKLHTCVIGVVSSIQGWYFSRPGGPQSSEVQASQLRQTDRFRNIFKMRHFSFSFLSLTSPSKDQQT
jgi:hypothetical protein